MHRRQTRRIIVSVLAAAVSGLFVSDIEATILLNETFTYSNGAVETVSSGAWVVHGGTGSHQVTSNALILDDNNTADINRALSSAATSGTIYAAFDLTLLSVDPPTTTAGQYFAHFEQNLTFTSRLFGRDNSGSYNLGIASVTEPTVWSTTGLALDTAYRIVHSYEFSTGVSKLWINPSLETSSFITSTATGAATIDQYSFRNDTTAGGDKRLDNLVVATTFTEALGASSTPNDSVITAPTAVDFGRVFRTQTPALAANLSKTGAESTTYAALGSNNGLSISGVDPIPAGPQTETFSVALVNNANGSNTTGSKTWTVTVDNLALNSAATGQGSADPNDVINVSATIVNNRFINGGALPGANIGDPTVFTPVDYGYIRVGASRTLPVTFLTTNSGPASERADDKLTRITMNTGATSLSKVGSAFDDVEFAIDTLASSYQFNDAADTTDRDVTVTPTASGTFTGTTSNYVRFNTSGEGLVGESADTHSRMYVTLAALWGSNASFSGSGDVNLLELDFGVVSQFSSPIPQSFDLLNLVAPGGDTAAMDLDSFTSNYGVLSTNLAGFSNKAAGGAASTYQAFFNTATLGVFSQDYTLQFSDMDNLYGGGTETLTLRLKGSVVSTEVPEPASLVLLAVGTVLAMPYRRRRA